MKRIHKAAIATVATVVALSLLPHRAGPNYYYPPMAITGVTNPVVTQATIDTTICVHGWTSTPGLRPSSSYTTALKKKQEVQYGLATTTGEEEDHFISLELGGHPTDPKNLWPESYPVAHLKDHVENYLKAQVCAGKMTLAEAQHEITTDWYAVYLHMATSTNDTKGPTFGGTLQGDSDDEDFVPDYYVLH